MSGSLEGLNRAYRRSDQNLLCIPHFEVALEIEALQADVVVEILELGKNRPTVHDILCQDVSYEAQEEVVLMREWPRSDRGVMDGELFQSGVKAEQSEGLGIDCVSTLDCLDEFGIVAKAKLVSEVVARSSSAAEVVFECVFPYRMGRASLQIS